MKKGDFSKNIDQAGRAHAFHRAVQDIKARNANADPDQMQALIDEAVRQVRAERPTRRSE
jgi:hypothetical protein